jgi:hypothetical protein
MSSTLSSHACTCACWCSAARFFLSASSARSRLPAATSLRATSTLCSARASSFFVFFGFVGCVV